MTRRDAFDAWWAKLRADPCPDSFMISSTRQELKTALEGIFNCRASQYSLGEIKTRFREEDLYSVSRIDGRLLHDADSALIASMPSQWRLVECAPLAPLGSNTALTRLRQFPIAYGARDSEVLPDAVVPLTFEASRLHDIAGETVTLAASHREVRMQPYMIPGYSRHFRAFSVASVGREKAHHSEKSRVLSEQLEFWCSALKAVAGEELLLMELSHTAVVRELLRENAVSAKSRKEHTREGAPNPLRELPAGLAETCRSDLSRPVTRSGAVGGLLDRVPVWLEEVGRRAAQRWEDAVEVRWDFTRVGGVEYYDGPCYRLSIPGEDGWVVVVDGGFSDWERRLSGNKAHFCLTGGLGTEHLLKVLTAHR